jgi:hypothetical protein
MEIGVVRDLAAVDQGKDRLAEPGQLLRHLLVRLALSNVFELIEHPGPLVHEDPARQCLSVGRASSAQRPAKPWQCRADPCSPCPRRLINLALRCPLLQECAAPLGPVAIKEVRDAWRSSRSHPGESEGRKESGRNFWIAEFPGDHERFVDQYIACIVPGDLRPERQQAPRQCQSLPTSSSRSSFELLSDLGDSPPRRGVRTDHEGSLARPEHHRGAVIPAGYGIPVVAHVAFVLRFEGLQFRGGLGVAELTDTNAAVDCSGAFARSDPVPKLDENKLAHQTRRAG